MAKRKGKQREPDSAPTTVLGFSEDHFWVRAEGEHAHIGLSDYAQDETGELIAVELPDIGDCIEKGEPFGEVESVRTVQELIAPVTGTVLASNADLEDAPSLANEDPYHDGWLIEVELEDEQELDGLMCAEDYEEFVSRALDE